MTILANHLVNNAHAELSANETTLSVKQLTNRGLIDGNETRITGTDITNIATGRIYGNHLALKANKLENLAEKQKDETQSATIAARKRLDFGVSSLTNRDHALILSLDKLFIGGALDSNYQAIGKATLVDNGSATIEALGDGGINTTRLKNHDLYIKTGIKTDKQYFKEYSPEDSSDVYLGRDGVNAQGWLDWNNNNRHDRNAYFRFDNGTSVGSPTWFQKFYTRTTHTTTLVHQDPAKIAFGGNLSLAGEHLLNYASKLLIGEKLLLGDRVIKHNLNNSDLSSKGTHLENIDLIGEIHRLDEGKTSTLVSKRKHKGTKKVWAHYTENINENFNRTLPVETFGFSLVLNQIGRPISSEAEIAKKADPKTIQVENLDLPHVNKSPIETVPLPQASLYKINPDAPHGYLVETDTRFTDPKQWLSSDYMFKQLRHNHENVHKRLGDGFYEQRLINEQIHQLTGRRYLEGYHDDLAQYQALMNSGVKYAKQFNLALGVGLTAKQMSELTTDMVWLVNKDVTLTDGRHLTVLVPQVYLVARNSNISAQGAVISANKIIGAVDNLENSGVIAGRDLTLIHANQLKNQGMILGESVDLSAKQNLINLGGKIEAVKDLSLYAGKKLDIQSTLSSAENKAGNFARTVLDQKASVKVTGQNGHLNLHSDGDLTIKAADIESQGALTVSAGNHLQITTLKLNNKEHNNTDSDNYYRLDQQYEVGSHLVGQDTVMLIGQNNTTLRQASVSSQTGKTMIGAKGDVRIESGTKSETLATHSKTSNHDMVSKSSEIRGHYHDNTEAVASEVDGKHVPLASEKGKVDINGSSVVADKQLSITGKQGVNITAAQNSHYEENEHIESKSGLMGGGGIGFTVGSKKEQIEQDQMQQSAVASQVGSLSGNTDIHTAGEYRQTGSIVTSKNTDINISAKSANISAVRSDYKSHYKYQMEQKGFSLALTGAVANAIQAVDSVTKSVKMVGESKNNRINAMAAANVGFEAMNAVDNLSNVADAVSKGSVTGGAVGVRVAYGQQKSVQTQHSEGNLAEKSQINAGGKVNIQTQGAGKDATLSITGSDVVGLGGTHLKADGNINIEAADENHLERSNNKSSGFNVGVVIQFGNHVLAGVTASGNVAKGYGNGESQAWVASQVGSQNSQTIIESMADTAIKGSQVKGNQISVSAENLSIESLQDTAKYQGKQQNISGQATMGYGFSASGSYNKSKINSDYASVKTQAGIFADEGGCDINIAKHTELTGGLITSTEKAEAENRNSFSSGTLNATNLNNHANYKGSSFGISGSVAANFDTPFGNSKTGIAQSNKQAVNEKGEKLYINQNGEETTKAETDGNANKAKLASGWASLQTGLNVGFGSDEDSQSSQTVSGINTKNITIRDEQGQLDRTGKTAEQIKAEVKTDITTDTAERRSGKLENKFDKEKVLKEIQTQVSVTKDFLDNAQKAKDKVIDYYQEPKRKELRDAITDYHNANVEEKDQYKAKIDELIKDIYTLEHIRTGLDLATGLVAGAPKVMSASTLISVLDTESRRESLNNSLLAAPVEDINDGGKLYSNVGHNSGAFDGIKLGGVRMNYGIICGADNSRCETDERGNLMPNEKGHIVYKGDSGIYPTYPTVAKLLEDRNVSGKLFGATGGFQATGGEIFGIKYKSGSFLDKLVETYGGQHDLVGGQWLFYDKDGNGNRNFTPNQEKWADRFSVAAVLAVTPTTVPHALPLEVRFLLFGVR
ncbi:hemagglutinin repeat-containing protein [Pasteurella bettyae]|uniref:hemagglutinin repeat-containing protein n=1 Tax=Pasteurella bettyae TaxID=752 RepID=UPI003F7F193E